jgi:hypothetical protein
MTGSLRFVIVFGVITAVTPAAAQVALTAEQMAGDCKKGWPHPEYHYCAGYLEGVVQTLQLNLHVASNAGALVIASGADGAGPLCVAASLRPDALAKAFAAYVDAHPALKGELPRDVAAKALLALDANPPRDEVSPVIWDACGRKPDAR